MNIRKSFTLSLLSLAVLAGCSSLPADNAALDQARSDLRMAQASPITTELAPIELQRAGVAVAKAGAAWDRRDSVTEVNQLSYLATQQVALARTTAQQKADERSVAQANAARDQARLAARTSEADSAQRSAELAQRQAELAQRQAALARGETVVAQRQADSAQQQAADAQARTAQLEMLMKELNAKQTDRGLVITIGDVLFDNNQAEIKAGGLRSMDKLVGFLKQYPQRTALIEGFTDSVGSESANQELSGRRADAVRGALVELGVGRERLATQGYGEAFPVAGNDSASGRQLNRRVEIILSDENGKTRPR